MFAGGAWEQDSLALAESPPKADGTRRFNRPYGTNRECDDPKSPALKCWAVSDCPYWTKCHACQAGEARRQAVRYSAHAHVLRGGWSMKPVLR
ncbi:MAG TPA: hypothetical protein VIH42_03485 [Thermoguttaceae bacterium]